MSTNNTTDKKSRGCGFGCLLFILITIGVLVAISLLVAGGMQLCGTTDEAPNCCFFGKGTERRKMGEDEFPTMQEKWSYGKGDIKGVRIPLNGMIVLGESSRYLGNATTVLRSIRRATHDPAVKGIVLEMNSGGGGITDSDIIYQALLDFKAHAKGRVVVTVMGDVAASGAYYIALASDYILAHPTTITGSIGVLMQSYNFKGLAEKLGIHDVTIKSGDNKDMLNPLQDIKPEQKKMLESLVKAMHGRFVGLVAENRNLELSVAQGLADGRIFLADEAVKLKLIDGVGYAADGYRKLAELLEVDSVKLYRYEEQLNIMDIFSPRFGVGVNLDIEKLLHQAGSSSGLMYHTGS